MTWVALVTGTSSGTGQSTAIMLAQARSTVVATMRKPTTVATLEQRAVQVRVAPELRRLDVQGDASLDARPRPAGGARADRSAGEQCGRSHP